MSDAVIVYAAMACPGSCFKSPLRSDICTRTAFGGFNLTSYAAERAAQGSTTAAEAQSEVDAAIRAVAAAAAAPLPPQTLGEHLQRKPPLALPTRALPEGLGVGGRAGREIFKAQPLAGVKIGIYKEVGVGGAFGVEAPGCQRSACPTRQHRSPTPTTTNQPPPVV
jgi:hypothetical protein